MQKYFRSTLLCLSVSNFLYSTLFPSSPLSPAKMAVTRKQKNHLKKVGFSNTKQPTPVKKNPTAKITAVKQYLRKSQRIRNKQSPNANQYAICNIEQLENLFFEGYSYHKITKPHCGGRLQMHRTEHRIISTSYKLKCSMCDFVTTSHRLYKTKKPVNSCGQPASTLNLALGNALLNSPIGIVPFREICMRIGLNPGTAQGLHKLIKNKCNPIVIRLAEQSMSAVLEKLNKSKKGVGASVDCVYNNRPSSNTYFQAGTQSVFTVVEDVTPNKKLVQVVLESKLCSTRHIRLKMGLPADCPNHPGCTATLKPTDAIGQEARPALKSAMLFKETGTDLERVTNDGDCTVIPAYKQIYEDCKNYKDPHHYSRAQKRHCERKDFSSVMFPGRLAEARRRKKNRFAEDVRQRCSAEITRATGLILKEQKQKKTRAITDQLIKKLQNTPEAIVMCYKGDCSLCHEYSYACNRSEGKPWGKHSVPTDLKDKIEMTEKDEAMLRDIILFRLGPDALHKIYCFSNTQKNEAVNRSLGKYNPKLVTFPRTWTGRVHACVLNINEGFKKSSELLLEEANHEISADVVKQIKNRDTFMRYIAAYRKRPIVKQRRVERRARWMRLHELTRDREEPGYSKGKELPLLETDT